MSPQPTPPRCGTSPLARLNGTVTANGAASSPREPDPDSSSGEGYAIAIEAIYSSFPATLHYYSPHLNSSLFDNEENDKRPDDIYDEAVIVDKDGTVFPAVSKTSVSNGAVMFPNTFMMQELVRGYYDETLDRADEGKRVDVPFIFTIPKGTPIPGHLILINEFISRFSLQPSRDLNQALDEFYNEHARKETVKDWLRAHPFQGAIADDADAEWMAK
ncbi:hypothetical protein CkaCkLH20_06239 [Colletotrichum karsti]|uniref:Tse2 ADP-ribosyltransferase toxin domain-containing protein n=1 Tax=Colletotrichum karsti TaxID=1095194 RepID=A0A9P6I736_9PEZI|nr:uncharacterized protein CkaCkLH20_06239 [Colletotrichum karsti]KAF9876296.1 hypothetical protein CkaCkLH20_06239 [Colletotrichum karsti]